MDYKKHPLSEQFTSAVSHKTKVFSCFGLSVVASLLVFTVFFVKSPFQISLFQGFGAISSYPPPPAAFSKKGVSSKEFLEANSLEKAKNASIIAEKSHSRNHTSAPPSNIGENVRGKTHEENLSAGEKSGGSYNGSVSTDKAGSLARKCDIYSGRWVRDETKPYYPAGSCPYIDKDFDCYANGRPDDDFLKWKWQPYDCDIPSLNATDFLERLRGKRLLFVGDSLNRNMWESLVCILRHSVSNKSRVYETSGSTKFKAKGYYSFRYEDYDCSVDFVRTTYLVRETFVKGGNGTEETLRLDLMDEPTPTYKEADVLVFNTGHWWTHEKTSRGKDYYQEGNYVYPILNVMEAYTKALTTWARWVDNNIDANKTRVFFRGYSLTHFRGRQWNSGGQCHKEMEPIFSESYVGKYPSKMKAFDRVLKQMKTPVMYLNISRLTEYRKDGHPSIYRKEYLTEEEKLAADKSQDCSHWCLPGIPDTWNELLYASLVTSEEGT